MKKILICLVGLVISLGVAHAESLSYQETTGDKVEKSHWQRTKLEGDRWQLIYSNQDTQEKDIFICDNRYDTLSWEVNNPRLGVVAKAIRDGDNVIIDGRAGKKNVKQTIHLKGKPWFQPFAYSLGLFSTDSQNEMQFFSIQPNELKPFIMKAKKQGFEDVEINGRPVQSARIEIRLDGLMSAFWSADYWFRKADGQMIQGKIPMGPPGTPETIVKLEVAQ